MTPVERVLVPYGRVPWPRQSGRAGMLEPDAADLKVFSVANNPWRQ